MDLLQSITLGLIQGTTEWLPISSTGHLRVAEHFFGLTVPLLFDVLLHFGTLLVTLIYFRGAIKNVLTSLWHNDLAFGRWQINLTHNNRLHPNCDYCSQQLATNLTRTLAV